MIARLTVDQIPLTFPIGHAFTKEANRSCGFDEIAFTAVWTQLLSLNIGEIYAVFDNGIVTGDQKIVALLGATFSPEPFSGQMTAMENFWYVIPERRQSKIGVDLLQYFEEDSWRRGCKQIVMVHLMALNSEALQKLYVRRGYSLIEQVFRKEI